LLNSWSGTPAGITESSPNRIDPNGIPEVNFTNSADNNAISTRFLQDASYLLFKNINLSYVLPSQWSSKLDLSRIRLNLTAENLLTLTTLKGMNPQQVWSGLQYNYLPTTISTRRPPMLPLRQLFFLRRKMQPWPSTVSVKPCPANI
jgi:hypothetical protein